MNVVRSFPHDLVISIMSRLPIKSLVRFKSVSKSWRNSIDDPNFIKSHATNSRLVVRLEGRFGEIEYYSMAMDSPQNLVREDFPELPKHNTIFVGSCNGLVCLLSYKLNDITGVEDVVDIFVWNIATKEYRIIPNPATTSHKYSRYCFGFGYDSVHEDYKVVRLGGPCGPTYYKRFYLGLFSASDFTSYETQFYSMRRAVWSAVKVYPTSTFYFRFGSVDKPLIFVNNALHISARRHKDEDSTFILAIDLVTEEFREISYPVYLQSGYYVVIGGCLGVQTYFNGTWVMKDYGVEESWTKLPLPNNVDIGLGKVSESLRHSKWAAFFPEMDWRFQVYYSLDGHCHGQLFWYDRNKGEFEEIVKARWSFPLTMQPMCMMTRANICAQTLVSLK